MSIQLFFESIKSPYTKRSYEFYLKKYGHENLELTDAKGIEQRIIQFILKMKNEGKSYPAISNYVTCLVSFYRINDVILNTKKITRFMPERRRIRKDRSYTHEEISKMLEIADERMRAVILILASSGIRVGAIPSLQVGNLQDKKLTVYENSNEEYFTFVTPECQKAVESYLDMRIRYGEKIRSESYLIREQFDIRDPFQIRKPKQVTRDGIQWMIKDIAKRSGVLSKEVALAHGFRKFFTTQQIHSKVNPEIREMLLGHKIGLASAYYRPTESEMYSEYEKAIDNLTINEENRLKMKVEKLEVERTQFEIMAADIEMIKKKIK